MSRQTNLRTMEQRIYNLEKNGGGAGGSIKWSDVTYKPFKTLDSNDFKVEGDKLKLKNSGGDSMPCIFITNTEEILAHTNDNKVIYAISTYPVEGAVTAFAGWKVTMSDSPSETDIVDMTSEELTTACANLDFIDNVDATSILEGSYANGAYDCQWTNNELIGHIYITRSFYVTDGYKNSYKVKTNDSGVMAITY